MDEVSSKWMKHQGTRRCMQVKEPTDVNIKEARKDELSNRADDGWDNKCKDEWRSREWMKHY